MNRPAAANGRRVLPGQPASLSTSVLYRDPDHYAKNPDFCLLPDGRLLCVFLQADQHVPFAYSRIVLMESADGGVSWNAPRLIAESAPVEHWGTVAGHVTREPWVTPRLSRLRDGRLVIVCDKDDFSHAHESQPPGIFAWWSDDDGTSWTEPANTGVPGIEPDQVVELPDGTLLLATHVLVAATGKLGQFVSRSDDGGQTWAPVVTIASDDIHNFCEGAIVPLPSGRLVCVIRENNHNNYPCYLSFSEDLGLTWSVPVEAPFSGDRPYGGILSDGRFFVTFANQAGRPTTTAWTGDIEAESGYRVSIGDRNRGRGTQLFTTPIRDQPPNLPPCAISRNQHLVMLDDGVLRLRNAPETAIRYYLLPPDWATTRVELDIELELEAGSGPGPQVVVQIARAGIYLEIGSDWLRLAREPGGHNQIARQQVDLSRRRTVRVVHRDGLNEVFVDGAPVVRVTVVREFIWDRSFVGTTGVAGGEVRLHRISYRTEDDGRQHCWEWDAASNQHPNQYEIERWIDLAENTDPVPDHGYTTWVELPDGRILVANTTSLGMPFQKAAIHGYAFHSSDLAAFDGGDRPERAPGRDGGT